MGEENNSFNIPVIDNDGNIVINVMDPEFPPGSLTDEGGQEIVNKWLDENYPDTNFDNLKDSGVSIEYSEGKETYEINGEEVTKEEYYDAIGDIGGNFSTGATIVKEQVEDNNTTLDYYDTMGNRITNPDDPYAHFANSHKEPGHIKIKIDYDKVEENLQNQTLSIEAVEILNKHFGEELFSTSTTLIGALDILNSVKNDGFTKMTNGSIVLFAISLFEKGALDAADLENVLDGDDSSLLRAVDGLAKNTSLATALIGTGLAITALSGGTLTPEVAVAGLIVAGVSIVANFIDTAIEDYDDIGVFSVNYKGNIEWNAGAYHGEIKIEEMSAQELYNAVAIYIEEAKCIMLSNLDALLRKRERIIQTVKSDIKDEMQNIQKESDTNALSIIYNLPDELEYGYTTQNNYKFERELPEGMEYQYYLTFGYNAIAGMQYHLQNDLTSSAVNSYNSSASIYDTDNVYTKGEIKKSSSTIFENDSDIEVHFSEYFKNYYNFYGGNVGYDSTKDDYVDEITEMDWITVEKVDLLDDHWWDLNKKDDNIYESNVMKYSDEAQSNKSNFMSVERINLAKEMIKELYNTIMSDLSKYSTLTDELIEMDNNISKKYKELSDKFLNKEEIND